MADTIDLILAKRGDAESIAVMSRDLVETGLGWCWTPERVIREIRNPEAVVLIARDKKGLIGFAIMDFAEDEAHLNLLAVKPQNRRLGIGRRLVHWLEKSACTAGTFSVHLEVRADNYVARAFYKALGFRQTSWLPRYYGGREPAIRMVHDLQRVQSFDK